MDSKRDETGISGPRDGLSATAAFIFINIYIDDEKWRNTQ